VKSFPHNNNNNNLFFTIIREKLVAVEIHKIMKILKSKNRMKNIYSFKNLNGKLVSNLYWFGKDLPKKN
jgi:hypothetical protein